MHVFGGCLAHQIECRIIAASSAAACRTWPNANASSIALILHSAYMDEELLGRVSIEETASPEDLAVVQDLFAQAGLQVTVSANYGRRSIEQLPWIVFISMGAGVFVGQIGADPAVRHNPRPRTERATAAPSCDSSAPAAPADVSRAQRHCPE